MKEMNKEELIELFIEQLGDNDIIGRVMALEQIKDKLNNTINDVVYDDTIDSSGRWNFVDGILTFDSSILENEILYFITLIHEMLHVLSSSHKNDSVGPFIDNYYKVGLLSQTHYNYRNNHDIIEYGRAINEGMTEYYASMILGKKSPVYQDEQDIYIILATVIGEEEMFGEYFSEDVDMEAYAFYSPFRDVLVKKYGEQLGEELDNDFVRAIELSDWLLGSRLNRNKNEVEKDVDSVETKAKEELIDLLESMLSKVLEYKPETFFQMKELISSLSEDLYDRFFEFVISKLLDSEQIDADEKISIIKALKEGIYLPINIQDKIIRFMDDNNYSVDQKLDVLSELLDSLYYTGNDRAKDIIYNWLVDAGLVRDGEVPKKGMLSSMNLHENEKDITENLKVTKYRKVADYYEMLGGLLDSHSEAILYDEDGKLVRFNPLMIFFNDSGEIPFFDEYSVDSIYFHFSDILNEETLDELHKHIQEQYSQYSKYSIEKHRGYEFEIQWNESMMILSYDGSNEQTIREYYTITEAGSLEAVKPRSRKKIYR